MTKLKMTPPPADYPFGYETMPTITGNQINGLGSRKKVRPTQVFHNTGRGAGRKEIPYASLDMFFNLTNPWPMFWENLKGWWARRHAAGPVTCEPIEVEDESAMAEQVKAQARALGIDLAGITLYDEETQMQGVSFPYKYAICLGHSMDRDEMLWVPHKRGCVEVMKTYRSSSQQANQLAAWIRTLGWQAEGYGIGEDIILMPMAIQAGIGELGKHGSLISKEFGSNFRLTCVLTDLPLALDAPVDIGVDDLCMNCQRCRIDCPPHAIFDDKQWVRGAKKWYVDFDKCIFYFTHTHGCAICLEVCPWSEPGRGAMLSDMLLAKRKGTKGKTSPAQAAE